MMPQIRRNKMAAFCLVVLSAFAATPASAPSLRIGTSGKVSGKTHTIFSRNGTAFPAPSDSTAQTGSTVSSDVGEFLIADTYDDADGLGPQDGTGPAEGHHINTSRNGDSNFSVSGDNSASSGNGILDGTFFPGAFGDIGSFFGNNGQSQQGPFNAGDHGLPDALMPFNAPAPSNDVDPEPVPTNDPWTDDTMSNDPANSENLTSYGPPANDPPTNNLPTSDPPHQVPEPLTLSLFAMGLAGTVAVRRQNRG
jgi:hypothetical protein